MKDKVKKKIYLLEGFLTISFSLGPHFELIFKVAKDLGILDTEKVRAEHIGFWCSIG